MLHVTLLFVNWPNKTELVWLGPSLSNYGIIWAGTSENVPPEMCAQRRFRWAMHSHSQIRIFTGCIFNSQGCKVSSRGQRRLWSDCEDAHTDLSLHWVRMSKGMFSHTAYHLILYDMQMYNKVPDYSTWPQDQDLSCPIPELQRRGEACSYFFFLISSRKQVWWVPIRSASSRRF